MSCRRRWTRSRCARCRRCRCSGRRFRRRRRSSRRGGLGGREGRRRRLRDRGSLGDRRCLSGRGGLGSREGSGRRQRWRRRRREAAHRDHVIRASERREQEVSGHGIGDRALGSGETGDEGNPCLGHGVTVRVQLIGRNLARRVLGDQNALEIGKQWRAGGHVDESLWAACSRRAESRGSNVVGPRGVGSQLQRVPLTSGPRGNLQRPGPGKACRYEVESSRRGGDHERS